MKRWVMWLVLLGALVLSGEEYCLLSPDGDIELKIDVGEDIRYSLDYRSKPLLLASPISLTLERGTVLGQKPRLARARRQTVDRVIQPVIRQKSRTIREHYNELRLRFRGNYDLVFRAYNGGAAYRFATRLKGKIKVTAEQATFCFAGDYDVYFPEEESFFSHNERYYIHQPLSNLSAKQMGSLPVLVEADGGIKVAVTEADLEDYPGLWLTGSGSTSLTGTFPGYPLKVEQKNDRSVPVSEYADFLAITDGSRDFPWRLLAVGENDGALITNQLTFLLAKPLQIKDTSWIRPGKVAWDWWNANNIFGVDFQAGINTATYKYYIDFAARYGLEYIILDEGWYKLGNLLDINPDIDMEDIMAHANEKNVGVILWVVWKTLDDQLEEALAQFEEWGVKGIKVDFMQRDDQPMVNFYHKIARAAAERRMVVDFHGSTKPCGLRRAYPNVLSREGVRGLEHCKWTDRQTPEHDVTIPFIRMLAGPMDYTPGAMINAQKENFRAIFKRPMSMGTRCHQLAMYVVYESPLQMLADSPSHYLREPECTAFIAGIPTVWDETRVIEAKVADYIVVARKSGERWYIGAMTDGQPREFGLDLSFLDPGNYAAEIFQDGANASRFAGDYRRTVRPVTRDNRLKIQLAPGGGWAATLSPE